MADIFQLWMGGELVGGLDIVSLLPASHFASPRGRIMMLFVLSDQGGVGERPRVLQGTSISATSAETICGVLKTKLLASKADTIVEDKLARSHLICSHGFYVHTCSGLIDIAMNKGTRVDLTHSSVS